MYILNDDQYEFDTDNIHLRPTTKISNKCLKIPIKIEAGLRIGSIEADLEEFRGLKHPFKVNINE